MKLTIASRPLPGYDVATELLTVFLDGEEVKGCWAFDTAAGVVHRYKVGNDGGYVFTAAFDDLESEVVHGKVTFSPKVRDGAFNHGPATVGDP